jgi:uncharacterized protein GlcG (DUF336 family)
MFLGGERVVANSKPAFVPPIDPSLWRVHHTGFSKPRRGALTISPRASRRWLRELIGRVRTSLSDDARRRDRPRGGNPLMVAAVVGAIGVSGGSGAQDICCPRHVAVLK